MGNYILEIAKILKSPADAGSTVVGASSENKNGVVISALAIAETLASTAYKSSFPGAAVLAASILNNIDQANIDLNNPDKNSIDNSTMTALATDALNLLGIVGLVAASPEIAVFAIVAATGMALYGVTQGDSTDVSDYWLNTLDDINKYIDDLHLGHYIDDFLGLIGNISDDVNSLWHAFKNWVAPRRDPLVLDLDGDGIETLGVNATTHVVFDYDGDGVKTGTGWIKGDDGFVVLDRNGNGTIDNGGELFGDQTLVGGAKATDGFAALSAEDTNKNGKFDAGDTNFTKVRIWQDTNSDGISQAGELHSLSALGIASINLASTATSGWLEGATQTATGTFTRTNGTTGEVGNLNFNANAFYREFTTPLTLTDTAKGLPDMQGSPKKSWIQGHRCYRTLMPRSKLKMIRNYHFLRFTPFAGMTGFRHPKHPPRHPELDSGSKKMVVNTLDFEKVRGVA